MSEVTKVSKGQLSIKTMLNNAHPQTNGTTNADPSVPVQKVAKGKSKALEDIYQKKTQLEHILLRPDTYIGSVEAVTENTWVFDKEKEAILQREVTYVPGLYKIFDEILVNAADHKQRDEKMDTIKVDINQEDNIISIWNNGKGIPVEMHKGENMYVPTMIFGHLLTSSNYDDEEQKVTGGRNGYGAKLCNIFSTKFVVETGCKDYKRSFKQAWANNMSKTSEPKVKEFAGSEFTKITFSPDLAKFKMNNLDDDIVSIMSRRAYDVAASARGVKVFLNGKRVPIKNFKEYVDLFLKDKVDEDGNQVKCVYENATPRWEVAIALSSDKGFQQMSFVNSIATTKGGRHVDYVTDMIVKNLVDALKKKNKSGVNIKPFQIKNHMWVFVNCLIVNPTFDSQTKENMTLQAKSFGSKCTFSEKFITSVSKCGIVEAIMMWAKFKQQQQLQSKCAGKKQNKLKGIPKLEDANDAGTRFSSECTLILTEGDSAKTLAVSGLGVVGRDRYGVFPLKGKLLNVREASHKQILENAEINNIIKIIGLQYKKKYDNAEDVKSLRYGKLMIMTDQDQDGSHIKGLLINFIHHNWPTLLHQSFLEEFITPIVKATKGTKEELAFYSLPEFEEWKKSKDNWHTYKIKYYKGLGTSTSKEAKEYFQDMIRHRIIFKHNGAQDDHSITMAFSKKAIEQRKEWLTAWMLECKRRKELGLSDIYLYEKNTRSINYSDFVNKELVLFSNLDNERSIPCLVDGLKPGQRKVLFTCLKRNDKREIKVAQLAGSVAEHSAYHHGEASLMGTIIGLAQNYVGSNNINLLKPVGQFGTRLQGGKDAASPRYIFTQLSSLTKFLFHPNDEDIINHLKDDNQKIEPEWYIPIIPMVLVNGAEGIGTGWSTKIPNYNPRDIVENIKRMIRGEEMRPMKPWFKNFLGTIDDLDYQKYVVSGEVGRLSHDKYEITELPVRTWTQHYKETVMEPLTLGTEKAPPLISDYREYHTDITVRFVVTVPESKSDKIEEEGPHKIFKLQSTISLGSMVLFDHNGCLKKYESVADILQEFYDLRLKYYGKRKAYLVGKLEAEANRLSNQARFILEKCDGRLTIENKKKKDMIAELQRKGYDSDPVHSWKKANDREALLEESAEPDEEEETVDDKADYDYLLGMKMWCLTKEKKDELLKDKENKVHELETLKKKSPSNLWEDDLDAFIEELDKVEQQEREDDAGIKSKKTGVKLGGGGGKRKKIADEVLPSPMAQRVAPKIDAELRKKVEKAAQAKEKGKKVKKEVVDNDEFDDLVNTSIGKSLADRVGGSPDQIVKGIKKEKKEKKLKQTKLSFSPKKLTVDTSDEDEVLSGAEDFTSPTISVEPRERAGGRRAAAAKVKYQFSDEESNDKGDSDSDLSLHSNDGVNEPEQRVQHLSFDDSIAVNQSGSEADEAMSPSKPAAVIKKPKANNKKSEENKKPIPKANGNIKTNAKKSKSNEIEISDTDSEFEDKPSKSKSAPPKPVEKPSASDMFDSLLGSNSPSKSNDTTPEKPVPSKKRTVSSSESDGESFSARVMANFKQKEAKKPAKAAKKTEPKETKKTETQAKAPPKRGPKKTAAAKRKANSDSDSDDIFANEKKSTKLSKEDMEAAEVARRAAGGRNKKNVKYNFGESDESDEDF